MKNVAQHYKYPPRIKGYFLSNDVVRTVAEHNANASNECASKGMHPQIAMLFLSVPRRCNLNCPYCYTDADSINNDDGFSKDEIGNIISTSLRFKARSIVVAGEGEPFASNTIWDIIEWTERLQMICVIFTNGSLISPDIAKELFTRQVSVILKVNSFCPSIQDRLVGVKDAHKKVYAGLEALLTAGFSAPRLAIQSAIMKPNIADLREVFLFCRLHNIVPYIETYVAMGRGARENVRKDLEPDVTEVTKFFDEMRKIDKERFGLQWPFGERVRVIGYGPCNKNQVAVSIRPDGDVFRCITESKKLGNIRDTSLMEILCSQHTLESLAKTQCTGCASQCLSYQVTVGKAGK